MKKKSTVEFKGTKDGLVIYCHGAADFEAVLYELVGRLQERASFFAGTKVQVDVGDRRLSADEKKRLEAVISENSGLMLTGIQTTRERSPDRVVPPRGQKAEGMREGRSLTIRRTLRSGQSVRFPGTVVILGDVNPGAEIMAEGDIIVFGIFRGTAHAGCAGDRSATLTALCLAPTQLRIADMIARAPDEEILPDQPESAYIAGDRIVVAAVNSKTGQQR